jgi:hypothetical protein
VVRTVTTHGRPRTKLIDAVTRQQLEEQSFVKRFEAAEILSDRNLLKRIKAGHAQSAARAGRFVRGL